MKSNVDLEYCDGEPTTADEFGAWTCSQCGYSAPGIHFLCKSLEIDDIKTISRFGGMELEEISSDAEAIALLHSVSLEYKDSIEVDFSSEGQE